jgi:hypothetical protein
MAIPWVSLEGLEAEELRQHGAAGKVRKSTVAAQAKALGHPGSIDLGKKDKWLPGLDSNQRPFD